MNRTQVLAQADRLINGDRQQAYGDASVSFARIAGLWSAYLGVPVAPNDAAAMMALLKISRARGNPGHVDSWVDGAAYLAIGGELATEPSND